MNIQKPWSTSEGIPKDLILIQEILFDNCNFEITQPILEAESSEYGACSFVLNNLNILFRTAKITPTKTGQFVTLWKRIAQGPIQPFDSTDPINLFIVSTRKDNHFGLFIFPKSILITKEIVSDKKEGKRAIRVYPPWDITTSKQAQKTQKWQLDYFLEIQKDQKIDLKRAKLLFLTED
ncbi:MepB domain containing protein [Flavobacterium aquariorum]|uniref:MepB domain containing protein n=1 Tax=Flavobacterium aquariorum TaxID=2217670 RepID=A0A2W7TPH3_9FLAO|nr:MepB family protein [Flavobacterium aquariorum]PZX92423.1 MepB domain containing protein [Flavobacterium aquariorum]